MYIPYHYHNVLISSVFSQEYPEKITKIVDDIAHLNLLEVADLNALLKARLNISDAPVMMSGGPVAQPQKKEVCNNNLIKNP